MPKTKVLLILKILQTFLKSELQLNVTGLSIRHACSDNTPFLGFFLRRSSDPMFLKNNFLEKFRRLKARIFRRHFLEHQKYLKLIEHLGRKAIRGFALSSGNSLYKLNEVAFNNLFIENLERAPWFEKNFNLLNKSFSRAILNRNKELNFRLEKWLNTCHALAGSVELLEFSKLVGGDVGSEILKCRENLIRSLKKAFQSTLDKSLSLKRIDDASFYYQTSCSAKLGKKNIKKIAIMAPQSVILALLKYKGVVGKNYSPISCTQLISQSEFDIIEWFSCVARGLLSFYSCASNFFEIKKIVK